MRKSKLKVQAGVQMHCKKTDSPVAAGLFHNIAISLRSLLGVRLSDRLPAELLAELRDLMREAGDLAACRVLVNDVALGGAHQLGLCACHRLDRCIAVAALDRVLDAADGATHLRAA